MNMMDAARLRHALPKRTGRFVVLVDRGAASDELSLQVTRAAAVLSAVRTSFIDVGERVWWRYPEKSFAYFCDNSYWPVCDEVERWLVAQQGITVLHFPVQGRNPFGPEFQNAGTRLRYYRYRDDHTIARVRRCIWEIRRAVRHSPIVKVELRTWTGEIITVRPHVADGKRLAEPPEQVTNGLLCKWLP
jgi:hypothetical protein